MPKYNLRLSDMSSLIVKKEFVRFYQKDIDYLWSLIPTDDTYINIFGKKIKIPRKQVLYGTDTNLSYSFSGQTTYAKLIDKDTLLENILTKINKYIGANFNTVLLNFYRDGNDYICSHSDDESDLDTTKGIWSLSIGGARTFNITDKNTNDKIIDVNLEDGMLVGMIGCFQKQFKHGIKKTTRTGILPRVNLTFRRVTPK
jgi:alkylated DNA repair dioxygenase AlkB